MKCVIKDSEVKRVSEARAIELLQKGWALAPKSAWKGSEGTSWVKSSVPANPISESKKRRQQMRANSGR